MEGCLKFPKPKIEHPMENELIFNQISIVSPENIPYSLINIGGSTSKAKVARLTFFYQDERE